jgi:sodium/hydrogen antiporter
MDLDVGLAAVGALGVLVVLISGVARHLPVSEPLLAFAAGIVLGPEVLALADFDHELPLLHGASELSVAIALMAVALRFPWDAVRQHWRPVLVMITIGMVAMAAIAAGISWWVLPVTWSAAVVIGGALAPTDPVLSSSIVTGEPAEEVLPERLRLMLSVESGLNDGLALPLVVAGIVLVHGDGFGRFASEGLRSVAIALVLGWLLGMVAGEVFRRLDAAHDIEDSAFFVFALVLPILVLGVVNLLHGDGILAVFAAGLAYNRQVGSSIYDDEREVEEGVNRVLLLPLFLLFGAVLPWSEWRTIGWAPLLAFAVAVLVLRRLPVVVVLKRALDLDWPGTLVYGWFGPMGAAALFFATFAHEEHAAGGVVWPAVAFAVACSTIVHGMTSAPVRAVYGKLAERTG